MLLIKVKNQVQDTEKSVKQNLFTRGSLFGQSNLGFLIN